MPRSAEETLMALIEAVAEGRETIKELHATRASAADVAKRQRQQIVDAVAAEVDRAVGEIGDEARAQLRARIDEVIGGIEHDWRTKLGLDQ
jgi:exosome complex RNA-binding protein Csl4